jgi:sugar phosphate isomerase/epimerase
VGLARALGLSGVDLGLLFRGALDRKRLLSDPAAMAREVTTLGIAIPSYFHVFGETLASRNCADPQALATNLADFDQVLVFCEQARIPVIFVSPGTVNPGQSRDQSLRASAHALGPMADAARRRGIALTFEPHVHSNADSPAAVLRLLELAPELHLTLDYSHLVCAGYTQAQIDPLLPFAAHVHLRQARPGRLQETLENGTIHFPALLAGLREVGYDGWLTLEYCYQPFMDMRNVDVLTEIVKMRDLVCRHRPNDGIDGGVDANA